MPLVHREWDVHCGFRILILTHDHRRGSKKGTQNATPVNGSMDQHLRPIFFGALVVTFGPMTHGPWRGILV